MQFASKIIQRYKALGLRQLLIYLFFTALLEKLGVYLDNVLIFKVSDTTEDVLKHRKLSFRVVRNISDLNDEDRRALLSYGGEELIEDFQIAFAGGERCAFGYDDSHLGCVCWAKNIHHHQVLGQQSAYLIWKCFTLPELRGRGLYPSTLKYFCSALRQEDQFDGAILIECSEFNQSSMKGIIKAGFSYKGRILRIGKWKKAFGIV